MGGEKRPTAAGPTGRRGSPPRGRGKACSSFPKSHPDRITPAWAGKRFLKIQSYSATGDHPRVGGEKQSVPGSWTRSLGSPPRGRGKVEKEMREYARYRITPAWAGKRSNMLSSSAFSRDHPRVGGEKSALSATLLACLGSPPRGRGKAPQQSAFLPHQRITPAWAGKSRATAHRGSSRVDHPRVGGEKINCHVVHVPHEGSPPRGRGKD